ncbi:Rz1-like lysis system protein LysC [Kingella potus]|uniref:Rz1-like lysis system protein LysC n=1 Tax=Kingella potus TaxID=265175 RepID=UPI003CCC63A8
MCKCRKPSNALFTILTASILTACANSTPPSQNKPPADLVQPCAKLQPLDGTTGADILPWALQTVHLYKDCAERHNALVSVFK